MNINATVQIKHDETRCIEIGFEKSILRYGKQED